ncbi:MAG: cell wall hydrolase [Alphaproteobacteria bacterium]|nr:cell wall hydrolase [Alphaproteobacteria bacterium]
MNDVTRPADVDTLARTIYGEARGEATAGMEAVASVIMNRAREAKATLARHPGLARHPLYGDGSPALACVAKLQFSCWNKNDPNREKLLAVDEDDKTFVRALAIAEKAIAGELEDRTGGANHYHAKNVQPGWAEMSKRTAEIGWHVFYKL